MEAFNASRVVAEREGIGGSDGSVGCDGVDDWDGWGGTGLRLCEKAGRSMGTLFWRFWDLMARSVTTVRCWASLPQTKFCGT